MPVLIEKILDLLPQTQCGRCGFDSCTSYATAIANGQAPINRCAAGGQKGIDQLATLLNVETLPLDTAYGEETPRQVATINEENCIGCTICIRMCPVDAIIGANRMMHTVFTDYCTGCGLCVPRCPLDAISLHPVPDTHTGWDAWSKEQAQSARLRYERKQTRLASNTTGHIADSFETTSSDDTLLKSTIVKRAIERARKRLHDYGIKSATTR
jgi:electron transport complex protein RnfB